MDLQLARFRPYFNVPTITDMASGVFIGFIMAIPGCMSLALTSLLGPLMGTSSVLWFIMRNDEAVKPRFAWV